MTNELRVFNAFRSRKVRGTEIKQGDTLYAIYNRDYRLYFIWCYKDKEFARKVMEKVEPVSEADIQANWRRKMDQLVPTERKE